MVRCSLMLGLLLLWQRAAWGESPATGGGGAAATQAASQAAEIRSKAVEKDGLSLTLAMPKAHFAADEPVKFRVIYKNVSDKTLLLSDPAFYWGWRMVFWDVQNDGPWEFESLIKASRIVPAPTVLKPGEQLEVPVSLDASGKSKWFRLVWKGIKRKIMAPRDRLEPGKYRLTVEITLSRGPDTAEGNFWTGTIATKPVEFTVDEAQANR